jgi:indole-3-glycerol phosphate synthase
MTTPDLLRRIVERRRAAYSGAGASRSASPGAGDAPRFGPGDHPFLGALARRPRAAIAEVKLGSPRLGPIRTPMDPERLAAAYAEAGAAALSVVVEPEFFFGSWELLARCRRASGLPTIAKDFVVHPRQIDEAATAGADAILLIAALYEPRRLAAWAALARAHGLVPLVEVHDEEDLARLARGDWELVGVNNRDLRTFQVEIERSIRLAPRLPAAALPVAESGISRRAEVDRLASAGYRAFLVGESLLTAGDPGAKLRELFG